MAKRKQYRRYEEELYEALQDSDEAVAYLNAALEEDDPEVFLLALRHVVQARGGGIPALAELTSLNREHLYRVLSEHGNPALRTLEKVLDALGLRLSIQYKQAS